MNIFATATGYWPLTSHPYLPHAASELNRGRIRLVYNGKRLGISADFCSYISTVRIYESSNDNPTSIHNAPSCIAKDITQSTPLIYDEIPYIGTMHSLSNGARYA